MDLDAELEKDLTFRRFNQEKQEQIRQLVSYTTLLGLTGNDLISIGGRLVRLEKSKEIKQNRSLAEEHYLRLQETWSDSRSYGRKFIYTTLSDSKYIIESDYWFGVNITNNYNGKQKKLTMKHYQTGSGQKGLRYLIAVNIHHGHIDLNF